MKAIMRPLSLLKGFKGSLTNYTVKAFFNVNSKNFATKKNQGKDEYSGSIMIRNENLKFISQGFQVVIYPFHPQVIKKKHNQFDINKLSSVIAMNFIPRTGENNPAQVTEQRQKAKNNWENRKSIAFRFNQLSEIIDVDTNVQKTWVVEVKRGMTNQYIKKLTFKNRKNSDFLDITLEQIDQSSSSHPTWKISTKMQHSQFNIMQILIKQSLFDLSGMKIMFDLRRNEELAKMTDKGKQQMQKDDLFKNYDNKDNII